MSVSLNTPADAVAYFLDSQGYGEEAPIRVGFRTQDDVQITCTDYAVRHDGSLMATGGILDAPLVQIRVRHDDYPTAYSLIRRIRDELAALKPTDEFVTEYDYGSYVFASFHVTSGPIYMGRDPKPGQIENFSLNGEVVLIPFTSP